MKSILFSILTLLFCSPTAFAGWKIDYHVIDVDTKDMSEVGMNLPYLKMLSGELNGLHLAADSKLKVVELRGLLTWYEWENDATCTVADPSKERRQGEYGLANFVYLADPSDVWTIELAELFMPPCPPFISASIPKYSRVLKRSAMKK